MNFETFVSTKCDVHFPKMADDAAILPWWNEPPDSHATYDVTLLRAELPVDCTNVVVPRSFAVFVGGFTPVLTVNHIVVEDGKPAITDSSFIVTVPHASAIFLRMLRMGKSAAAASVLRLRLRRSAMATIWSDVVSEGESTSKRLDYFTVESPLSAVDGMGAL